MRLLTTLALTGEYFFDHSRMPNVVRISNESSADRAAPSTGFHLGVGLLCPPFHSHHIISRSDVDACCPRSTKVHPPQSAPAPGLASVRSIMLWTPRQV